MIGIRGKIAGPWNIDTTAVRETLYVRPEECSEVGLVGINEESGCDKNEEDVPEKVTSAKKP